MAPWETLQHPSDLLVRVRARDRRELFAEAARSVFALSARPRTDWPTRLETRVVDARGDDEVGLLHRVLSECAFQFETDGFLARDVAIEEFGEKACRVRLSGARFEPGELEVDHVIKAVTWHGLAIREDDEGVCAEILHDL